MALIAMAVYSTEENKKDDYLEQTLYRLLKTVNFKKHRLMLSLNGKTPRTDFILQDFRGIIEAVIHNGSNVGTAKAINRVWIEREPGEHAIKMDDDITIYHNNWIEEMEEAIRRDSKIGQVGLKRKDCWEYPTHPEIDFRSELIMLPHIGGEKWMIVEKVKHVIGSCVMHSSALLDKVGFLYQPSLYGYDDVIMSHRTHIAGFYSCFLPHINIDHIDSGQTEFQTWKHKHSGEATKQMIETVHAMYAGTKPIYYEAHY